MELMNWGINWCVEDGSSGQEEEVGSSASRYQPSLNRVACGSGQVPLHEVKVKVM